MRASPWLRKLLLTVHVTTSVGWVGAIIAYIVVNVVALVSPDPVVVRGAYLMLDPLLRFAILPLGLGCLATGVVQSLLTWWGLLRHYWVVLSLWLTALAVGVLLMHAVAVATISTRAAGPDVDPDQLSGDLPYTIGGLLVCVPLILNIYKPRGLTRRGRRHRNRTTAAGRRPAQVGGTQLNSTP